MYVFDFFFEIVMLMRSKQEVFNQQTLPKKLIVSFTKLNKVSANVRFRNFSKNIIFLLQNHFKSRFYMKKTRLTAFFDWNFFIKDF